MANEFCDKRKHRESHPEKCEKRVRGIENNEYGRRRRQKKLGFGRPEKAKIPFRLCVSVFLLALNILMAVLSYQYLMLSNKVTPVMGVSYFVINGVLLLCFSLMAIHTVRFIANDVASLKRSSK